jgi:hypothetical protein
MLANDFKLITKARAADVFGVDVKTIDNYIKAGKLPAPKQFVSKEYWHPDDFEAFLSETFRGAPASVEGVTPVTAAPAGGAAIAVAPASAPASSGVPANAGGTSPKPNARTKDTSPVVRQRVRRTALLARLNAVD